MNRMILMLAIACIILGATAGCSNVYSFHFDGMKTYFAERPIRIVVQVPLATDSSPKKTEKIRKNILASFTEMKTPNVNYNIVFKNEELTRTKYDYLIRIDGIASLDTGVVISIIPLYPLWALNWIFPNILAPNLPKDVGFQLENLATGQVVSTGELRSSIIGFSWLYTVHKAYKFKNTEQIAFAIAKDMRETSGEDPRQKAGKTVKETPVAPTWTAAGVKKRVAVLDFRIPSSAVTADEVNYITNIVRGNARQVLPSNAYIIMTKENIIELLPPGKSLTDCVGECAVEIGRNIGADFVVDGEIIKFGSQLRVSYSLHDTREGNLLSTERSGGATIIDLESPMEESCYRLFLVLPGAQKSK